MATSLPRSFSERCLLTSWFEPNESAAGRFSDDMVATVFDVDRGEGCGVLGGGRDAVLMADVQLLLKVYRPQRRSPR